MASPFPGVDPFLESQHYWPDFHSRFTNCWCEAIARALPAGYEARIEEQMQILELETENSRLIEPDVSIARQPLGEVGRPRRPLAESAVATLESATVPFPQMQETRSRWIQIFRRPERSLVAVLELLSPTNKTNPGRGQYLAKRSDLFIQEIHLIEVDLLTTGKRLPMGRPLPPADYYALVARSDCRPDAAVYAWTLREPLPRIPIPLLKPDKDIIVDLGAVFANAYERGDYGNSLDYAAALPTLSEESRHWAEERGRSGCL